MHIIEQFCLRFRHSRWLNGKMWIWDWARPTYNRAIAIGGRRGLPRCMNGTDRLRVIPALRGLPETYEPQVWKELVGTLHQGDTVADVGASVGLYTVACAQKVGPGGMVFAFEPDPPSFGLLAAQVKLNGVSTSVELVPAAAGASDTNVAFSAGRAVESHVSEDPDAATSIVNCVRLDTYFARRHVNVIKIDVEGYEEEVLKGAIGILSDASRRPRAIFIEVHPFAWDRTGASDRSILNLLNGCGYSVRWLNGQPVEKITAVAEIVARHKENAESV